jgi:hypothetical protein
MLKKLGRVGVLIMAVLVILLSVGGIVGAWGFARVMSDLTVTVFSVVQVGVGVVDTAAGRVDTLVHTARSEVQQTEDTITGAAENLQENKPVLTALNERLETRLGPTIDTMQGALAPVHDALVKVDNAVSLANSIPLIQEKAPRLDQLDETLTQITGLGADVQQLRTTLRVALVEETDQLTQGVATALTDLTSRIDGRLAKTQANVEGLQADIAALQARLEQLQSRLLLLYTLIAVLVTLLFVWVIYSQIVVIRHFWARPKQAAPSAVVAEEAAAASAGDGETAPAIGEATAETV